MVSYHLSERYDLKHFGLYQQIPILTKTISDSYPGHMEWIDKKFLKQLHDGLRGYAFSVDYNTPVKVPNLLHPGQTLDSYHLSGCSLLKKDKHEKKICCLFVDPNYRKQGIASRLIESSFEILGTDKPLITVSEHNLPQLKRLLEKFNFELTSVKDSVYLPGVREYYYNEGLAR
jgi:ribosomal protein S18 acetylase RimI-like enzyme